MNKQERLFAGLAVYGGEKGGLMKHAAVIFSLEGTLLDTLEDLTSVVNKTLKGAGYPEKTKEEIAKGVGNNMGELIRAVVPKGTTWEESYDLIAPCYEEYANSNTGSTKPYDGVLDLLKTLQKEGVKVAVISNKPEQTAIDLCKTALDDCVSVVLGAKDEIKGLPAPDLIFAAAKGVRRTAFQGFGCGQHQSGCTGGQKRRGGRRRCILGLQEQNGFGEPERQGHCRHAGRAA